MAAPGSIWMRPERPARGPSPAYSREQITAAAIKIADAEGLEAVSMRRVARAVGAGAMSLYRYVDSKDDLIELMVDAVDGEDPVPERPSGDWRADLTGFAGRIRAALLRHPWLATIWTTRPTFGPNRLRVIEYALSCVDGLGLSIDEMLTIIMSLNGFVRVAVQGELSEAEAVRRTKLTEEEWRLRQSPYVQKILDGGEYPLFAKVITDAAIPHMDPDRQFRTGLEHLLDGIAAQLDRQG
jgi:AcrR family transcriptional regulator